MLSIKLEELEVYRQHNSAGIAINKSNVK